MKKGDHIAWKWGNGIAEGVIEEVHHGRKEVTSKGKVVTRNGTQDNPALVISHKSGNPVLKLASEVQKTQ